MSNEPEITKIAATIAQHVRADGVDHAAATETWRHALRFARSSGSIDEIAKQVSEVNPSDATLQASLAAVVG